MGFSGLLSPSSLSFNFMAEGSEVDNGDDYSFEDGGLRAFSVEIDGDTKNLGNLYVVDAPDCTLVSIFGHDISSSDIFEKIAERATDFASGLNLEALQGGDIGPEQYGEFETRIQNSKEDQAIALAGYYDSFMGTDIAGTSITDALADSGSEGEDANGLSFDYDLGIKPRWMEVIQGDIGNTEFNAGIEATYKWSIFTIKVGVDCETTLDDVEDPVINGSGSFHVGF